MSYLRDRGFWGQISVLIFLMLSGLIIGSVLSFALIKPLFGLNPLSDPGIFSSNSGNPLHINILKFMQLMQVSFMFIIPANVYAYFYEGNAASYFQLKRTPGIHYSLAIVLMLVSTPAIAFLITWNEGIQLPSFLSGLDKWMRASEAHATALTEAFLNVDSLGGLFINILIIAVLAAFGEELIFRGILQRLIIEKTQSIHWGVWISAVIFSAFHMQFLGFVPRLVLGALLGYSFIWSGSLFVPILAHFFNNATAVIAHYLFKKGYIPVDINREENFGIPLILISFILSFILIYFWNKKVKPAP